MDHALVSIIIPTYNSAAGIDLCLRSISSQTFREYEVIIADGLSTDSTVSQVEKFIPAFNNQIKITSKKDNGIYDAMNKGLEQATGEWIFFLGSDDELHEDTVLYEIFNRADLKHHNVL